MLCVKDYADKLLAETWPCVVRGDRESQDRAEASLARLGCNHTLAELLNRIGRWERELAISGDLYLGARGLKKLLAYLGECCVCASDWPYDYLDVERKLYRACWITSRRYHWWLVCQWLCGGEVPADVHCDLELLGIDSKRRRQAHASSLRGRIGLPGGAAFDA